MKRQPRGTPGHEKRLARLSSADRQAIAIGRGVDPLGQLSNPSSPNHGRRHRIDLTAYDELESVQSRQPGTAVESVRHAGLPLFQDEARPQRLDCFEVSLRGAVRVLRSVFKRLEVLGKTWNPDAFASRFLPAVVLPAPEPPGAATNECRETVPGRAACAIGRSTERTLEIRSRCLT